jgi:hypothetical protein
MLPIFLKTTQRSEREKACEPHSAESTTISQRYIHGEVCTKASKEALWRITASDCYRYFTRSLTQNQFRSRVQNHDSKVHQAQ